MDLWSCCRRLSRPALSEKEIAPTLLATTADLQELVDAKTNRAMLDLPLLKGWRRILVGELLLDALNREGRLYR